MSSISESSSSPLTRSVVIVIVAGCVISLLGFGMRSSFGLFLEPMTTAHGWSRETFGLALAIQNLMWAGAALGLLAALIHIAIDVASPGANGWRGA